MTKPQWQLQPLLSTCLVPSLNMTYDVITTALDIVVLSWRLQETAARQVGSFSARPQHIRSSEIQSGSIAELPPHVLAVLLRYVPLAGRVTNCSLVSTQFREAAAAATLCISTNLRADELGNFSFRAWLQRYGAHVTSLQLASTAVTDLPCQQLKQLKLSHCAVQLGADSGQNALICSTQLTSLELDECVPAGGAQLPAVATLTNLQRFDLQLRTPGPFHGIASDSLLQELSQCSKLTHLGLSGAGIVLSDASLQHLSAVTGLEALKLHWWGESSISAAGLSTLQYLQHLRTLDLETWYQGMILLGSVLAVPQHSVT